MFLQVFFREFLGFQEGQNGQINRGGSFLTGLETVKNGQIGKINRGDSLSLERITGDEKQLDKSRNRYVLCMSYVYVYVYMYICVYVA